jgi:hypothetical protein
VAIFFACPCGQSLRADEERAGVATRCPACGTFVRSPSVLHANEALGIAAGAVDETPPSTLTVPPMPIVAVTLVEEILSAPTQRNSLDEEDGRSVYPLAEAGASNGHGEDVRKKLDRKRVQQILNEAKKRRAKSPYYRSMHCWQLETHWYQCLNYPVRAAAGLFGLAVAWAILTSLMVAFLPDGLVPLLPFVLAFFAYTIAGLQATLAGASSGQAGFLAWIDNDPLRILRSAVQAELCILAGPIVPAGVAFFFWLYSGDLQLVDVMILGELCFVAAAWWVLALLAVQQKDRFRDANPVAIIHFVHRHGWRPAVAALAIALAMIALGAQGLRAMEALHEGLHGWLGLVLCWGSLFFWVLFILRWLGVSQFHAKKDSARQQHRAALPARDAPNPSPA